MQIASKGAAPRDAVLRIALQFGAKWYAIAKGDGLVNRRIARCPEARGVVGVLLVLAMIWALAFSDARCAFATDGAETGDLQAGEVSSEEQAAEDAAAEQAERIASMAVAKDGLYYLFSAAKTSLAVSVADESAKAGAKVAPAERAVGNWSQKWLVVQDKSTGYYMLRNLRSRMVLAVAGKAKSGAAVKQSKAGAALAQRWELVKSGGRYQLRSAKNPKLALALSETASGAFKFSLRPAKEVAAQQFRLRKADPIEDGHSFFIRSAAAPKKGLAVEDASTKAKARIALSKRSSAKAQKFRLEKAGASYRMQCVQSCQYVRASKGALQQMTGAKGKAKKWKFVLDLGTGTFRIKSASTRKYVDASGGTLTLRQRKTVGPDKSQRFILVPTYGFTVFLDAGHGRNAAGWGVYDPGAPGSGYEEAPLTEDLANRVEEALEGSDVRVFNGVDYSVPYWQRNAKARSLGCDVVLSIHFDAGGGSTASTMVGTHGASGSSAFNSIIHRKLVGSVGLRDGGTSHRSDITVVNGSVPAVLMEVCFIDNSGSLHTYLNRRSTVAASLAEGIVEASKLPVLQR